MLQQEEFIKRLKKIIDDKQLSSSSFADEIQVPRSSISHLLSGRNKPSLDFVLKVVHSYPEIDLNWLLFGKETQTTIDQPTTEAEQEVVNRRSDSAIEKIVVFYNNGQFKEYKPS